MCLNPYQTRPFWSFGTKGAKGGCSQVSQILAGLLQCKNAIDFGKRPFIQISGTGNSRQLPAVTRNGGGVSLKKVFTQTF